MRLAFSLLVLGLTACRATPPHLVEGAHGTARAYAPEVAAEVSAALDVLAPAVRDRLHSARTDAPLVFVQPHNVTPTCYARLIELGRSTYEVEDWRFVLHHELVHWYAEGTWVDALPHVLEEGVADYLTCEHFLAVAARAAEIERAGPQEIGLGELVEIDRADWLKFSRAEAKLYYRTAFELVRRIGLERLRELALTDGLSAQRIHRALNE